MWCVRTDWFAMKWEIIHEMVKLCNLKLKKKKNNFGGKCERIKSYGLQKKIQQNTTYIDNLIL